MTGARRRWLLVAVAVLGVVALLAGWSLLQAERRSAALVTGSDVAEPTAPDPQPSAGVAGGTLGPPSNALGAPVVQPEVHAVGGDSPIPPWWDRVPPVAGDLVPGPDRTAAGSSAAVQGHVRIDLDGGQLQLAIEGLRVPGTANVRVALSSAAVTGADSVGRAAQGPVVDLASVPTDEGRVAVSFPPTPDLPAEVRSVVLLDADTGDLVGAAGMLPTD